MLFTPFFPPAGKPTNSMFADLAQRMTAKFEVSPEPLPPSLSPQWFPWLPWFPWFPLPCVLPLKPDVEEVVQWCGGEG